MSRILSSGAGVVAARAVGLALAVVCGIGIMSAEQSVNALTAAEQAEGWKLLFDGKTLQGWRAFRSPAPPGGWKAIEGELVRQDKGGDLMTAEQFDDFELRLEWKVTTSGNSGIMFRVTDEGNQTYETGPELQILDNAGHKDGKDPMTSAGSNYAMHPPVRDVTKPVGEWNEVRLIVDGAHVEHWMNGVKLLEYELWSEDWGKRVKASKFAKMPGYGRAKRGHIVLQDHGDLVWFRNIKIKPL
ncbi:MAG TPA: DUF1080 domain-containing protein [Vicinamibacterales bacterium]|nr:DUF1080 domain-containing protein [Vicinamibacterales bacterium]